MQIHFLVVEVKRQNVEVIKQPVANNRCFILAKVCHVLEKEILFLFSKIFL